MIDPCIKKQINFIEQRCKKIKPLVAIRCITFNQEEYIKDALEGFLMQKTDFPFIAIVHDDASTDKTPLIIKEYAKLFPDIIFPIFENENQYSKHNGSLGKIMTVACKSTNAKFIALCEGDDYWIDPSKLQTQVNILNKNPEYGLIYTDYNILHTVNNEIELSLIESGKRPIITTFEQHLSQLGYIAPMSWLYRSEYIDIQENFKGKSYVDGSFIFALEMFLKTKVYYLNQVTCIYRDLQTSASHHTNKASLYKYYKGLHDIQLYYATNYDVTKETLLKMTWFYQQFSPYIILTRDETEIVNARHFLKKNWFDKRFKFKRRCYNLLILLYDLIR